MLQDSELARRVDGVVRVRAGGLRLRWELNELVTADGHAARGFFSCTVRALPEANEVKMLEEALLSGGAAASGADVVRHFAGAISVAARKFARGSDAESLVGEEGRRGMLVAIVEAAREVAFGCGVEVIPPASVEMDCPTLNRQQVEAQERQAAQRRTADQVEHLRKSAELFAQFEAMRAAAPGLSPGQVLSRMGEADRADVFRAILAASPSTAKAATLWAAAGPYLVRIDAGESGSAELVSVPADLGPLRSVRGDGCGGLLIGCRAGVLRVNAESPGDAGKYFDPGVTSPLGFNSAALRDGCIWAAHGEAGLVCWDENRPEKPWQTVRPELGPVAGFSPRNLMRAGPDRLVFSSGPRLFLVGEDGSVKAMDGDESAAGEETSGADVVGIIARSGCIIVVRGDGEVSSWSAEDLKVRDRQHRAGRVTAAAALPWMGDARLVLATEDGPAICVGMDDELITQYASAYRGLRMVAGAGDRVAAVSADRQRVIVWHAWDGRKPFADLHVFGLAKHRVADVVFV